MWLFSYILTAHFFSRSINAERFEILQPAFRFSSEGSLIECLVTGLNQSLSVHILPAMRIGNFDERIANVSGIDGRADYSGGENEVRRSGQSDAFGDDLKSIQRISHNVAWLPGPEVLNDDELYAVRCVSLYSKKVGQSALDMNTRWASWKDGAAIEAKELFPAALNNNPNCAQLANLIGRRSINESSVLQIVKSLKIGACPGVIVEGGEGKSYTRSNEVFKAPPALIRIQRSTQAQESGISKTLPHCTAEHSSWGRWLPLARARHLIINGASIPQDREKYWVPYFCKSTYWDRAALSNVAERRFIGESKCNLDSLKKVLFLGDSTTSGLFASMREYVFGENGNDVARNKTNDHLLEEKGVDLSSTKLGFPGVNLSFSLRGYLLPDYRGKLRDDMLADRRDQIEKILTDERPSAIVINIGIHEFCGAFGSNWLQRKKKHAPCSTRTELRDAYLDYGAAISEIGYTNRTLFRSIYGTFSDIPLQRWRWKGFVVGTGKTPRVHEKVRHVKNPCPAVAGPASHAAWVEDDAHEAWANYGIRFVDAWAPVHASPTTDIALVDDGLHLKSFSDEALAINQLVLGSLCALP